LRVGVRSFTHQRWVILFRPLDDTIQVLAVFDGKKEYTRFFKADGEER